LASRTDPLRAVVAFVALIAAFGDARASQCPGESAEVAAASAQEVVRTLYATPAFTDSRNDIDATAIRQLEPYLTDRLVAALQAYRDALAKSKASPDASTKSPFPEGPVFHSNYEGMDTFDLSGATAAADRSFHVSVGMKFVSSGGSAAWTDIAVLRCEGGGWRLDEIMFDPDQPAPPSLSERIAVK
jgi:hypothetical protein